MSVKHVRDYLKRYFERVPECPRIYDEDFVPISMGNFDDCVGDGMEHGTWCALKQIKELLEE